jgi:type II secretory pathway pseudopilin PulG
MFTSPPPNRSTLGRLRRRAFTLIEVVLSLTILTLITGTLFAIIRGAVKGAAEIQLVQRENDSINRFLDLCRKTFSTLPSTATLELTPLDSGEGAAQELVITGAPGCFSFGLLPFSYSATTLGLRIDPEGSMDANGAPLYYLSLTRPDLIPKTDDNDMVLGQELTGLAAPDEQGRNWMPLLPEVSALHWRFYVRKEDVWYEEWAKTEWPDVIEVQLTMKDRTTPTRMVFSVPTMLLTKGTGTSTTSTSGGTASTSSDTGGRGSPQGGQGGGRGQDGGPRGGPRGSDGGGRGGPTGGPRGGGGDGGGRGGPGGGRPGGDGGGRGGPGPGGGGSGGPPGGGGGAPSGGGGGGR